MTPRHWLTIFDVFNASVRRRACTEKSAPTDYVSEVAVWEGKFPHPRKIIRIHEARRQFAEMYGTC
jgi:hypothetical protein